jgi:hypothetical protein
MASWSPGNEATAYTALGGRAWTFAKSYGVDRSEDGRYYGAAKALYSMGASHPPHTQCTIRTITCPEFLLFFLLASIALAQNCSRGNAKTFLLVRAPFP